MCHEAGDENVRKFPHGVVLVSKLGDGVGQIDAEIRPFRVIDDSCVVRTVVVCGVNKWNWEQFLEP